MSDIIYKLFATGAASLDSAASLDFQNDGLIEGILLDLSVTGADALDDGAAMEISFGSTSGFTSNDSRNSIAGLRATQGFLTSGGGSVGKTVFVGFTKGVPVAAGERIFLHVLESGAVTAFAASVWIYVKTTNTKRASARRR